MSEVRAKRFQLEEFTAAAMMALGLPSEDAATVATLMVQADMQGSDGHGVIRLAPYAKRILAGGINLKPNIKVVLKLQIMTHFKMFILLEL